MSKKRPPLLPQTAQLLVQLGDRLRLARLRRGQTAQQVAERAGMTPMTLRGIERGAPGATIGAYLAVMQVLGLQHDIAKLIADDPLGRDLQDAHLRPVRRRVTAPKPGVVLTQPDGTAASQAHPRLMDEVAAPASVSKAAEASPSDLVDVRHGSSPQPTADATTRSNTLTTSKSLVTLLKPYPRLARKPGGK